MTTRRVMAVVLVVVILIILAVSLFPLRIERSYTAHPGSMAAQLIHDLKVEKVTFTYQRGAIGMDAADASLVEMQFTPANLSRLWRIGYQAALPTWASTTISTLPWVFPRLVGQLRYGLWGLSLLPVEINVTYRSG